MSGLGRNTADTIDTPNQHFEGNILDQTTAPSIKAHATKGRNTSGRSWKLRPQKRASSLITKNRANARSKSWEARQQERALKAEVKSAQQQMMEERIQAKRDKRERRLENERRRMENEYNNAKKSMQTLNHKKLGNTMRAMNKKQLRQIKKTRMNTKTGAIEFVGAYEK